MRHSFLVALCYVALSSSVVVSTAVAQTTSASPSDSTSTAPSQNDSGAPSADASTGSITTDNPSLSVASPAGRYLFNPISIQPNGVRIGPLQVLNLSTSGFFQAASGVDGRSQDLWGSTVSSNLGMIKVSGKSQLTISASPQFLVVGTQPFVNAGGSINFTYNLTPRWTLLASAAFSYSQMNSLLLQNPQYFLIYVNGGYAVQTLYAQTLGSAFYATSNFSANYILSGRTQISFSPQLGSTLKIPQGTCSLFTI